MKINKKKKAFTLTELLVVVIIIGVLSAVVLPKFNKIIETRKTTEAEELMAVVRTEQEKRCSFDKNYLTTSESLADILPSSSTKNFDYSFTSTGMLATSKGKYKYQLQMPSYEDGRICCENATECLKLNKDYPLCSELLAKADYDDGTACAGTTTPPVPPVPPVIQCPGSATEKCGCNNGGYRTRVCNPSTGEWSAWSACSISDECECTGTKPAASQTCNSCGSQTRTVSCDTSTGKWSIGSWGSCSVASTDACEEKFYLKSSSVKTTTCMHIDGSAHGCTSVDVDGNPLYAETGAVSACSEQLLATMSQHLDLPPEGCTVGQECSACTKTKYYELLEGATCAEILNANTPTIRYTVRMVLCTNK